MAADHDSLFSATSAASEDEVIMQLPLAAPALNPGAAAAAATTSFNMESNLLRVQSVAGAHNSIDGSARENDRELNPALIPYTNVDIDPTSTRSCPPIKDVLRSSLKRTLVDDAAVHLQVPAVDHNELQFVALQDDDGEHCMSSITRAHEMQSPSKKLHATKEVSTERVEVDRKYEEGEVDEEEEEEGCVTPTARDQRIPQYNVELNTSGLVCPPAPKKKPKYCASRRSRRLFYSANDAGGDVNYHIVAERRAFLVDPPDLHNFPDCIRALFK